MSSNRLAAIGDMEQALGRCFRDVREKKQLSRAWLAKRLGTSSYTLQRHEAGATMLRANQIVRAAMLMGVQPATLLGRVEWQTNEDT